MSLKKSKIWFFTDPKIHTVVCNAVYNLSEEHTEFFRFEYTFVYTYDTTRRRELEYQ